MRRILYYNLTYRCNQKCRFCFSHNTNRIGCHSDITLEQFKESLKICRPGDRVVLNGGEPTLHADIIRMTEAAKDYGVEVVLYTNGTQLALRTLATDILSAGIDRITIPIHGERDLHDSVSEHIGSYDAVCQGLDKLVECAKRPVLELKFVVTEQMAMDCFKNMDFVNRYVDSGALMGAVVAGQVNTRVSALSSMSFRQTDVVSEYIANSIDEVSKLCPVKVYDVECCRLPKKFKRWFEGLMVVNDIPLYEYYFIDANCRAPRRLTYASVRRLTQCRQCSYAHFCRSIVDGYLVMEIKDGYKSLVLE